MTSKIVVNNIESDAGVSTVFFNSDIGGTGGTLNVDGNLNVDGVLSYEDVTNIDSVGVVTARNIIFSGSTGTPGQFVLRRDSDGANIGQFRSDAGTDDISIGNGSSGSLIFKTGANTERLRITSNGKVGIDSTTPHRHLVVGGGGDISCLGTNGGIYFGTSIGGFRNNGAIARAAQAGYHVSGSQVGDLVMAPEADKDLIISSGSTNTMYERIRVTTGGNIGINKSNPTQKLFVGGNIAIQESGNLYFDATSGFSPRLTNSVNINDLSIFTNNTERLRVTSEGSALLTTDGQSGQYSYAMKLGQGAYLNSGTTSPHYGLWVRQLGPRYGQNFGIYSEVEDDSGMFGGATLDGLTSVSGIGVFGGSPISASAYQKAIGVYGKATNETYNYNSAIGVRGRVETGTTSYLNNNGQLSYGGHFVATGKSDVVGVYADAYLAGSPGANQVAIPLLVSSNGSEKLRVTSGGNIGINCNSPDSMLELNAAAGTKMGISLGAVGDSITASRYIGICKSADQTDLGANSGFSGIEFGGPYSTDEGYLAFHTHDLGVESGERMRLKKDGALLHKGNNSSTIDNTDGDGQSSAGYPAGGATFNKNVSVNNNAGGFGQCMNMISHTKSITLNGSTNHDMINIWNREGCFIGHVYAGYSTSGDAAVAMYKFHTFYNGAYLTAEISPQSRSSDTISVSVSSSGDRHTFRVNGNGYSGDVTIGLVFLSAGVAGSAAHYGVKYY